jgi:4-nitrophenyl phosphatase
MASRNLSSIKALILDMDGVLWRGDEPIGDLPASFAEMERRGLKVALATNNSTQDADQYIEKLARFGVKVNRWQIINSSEATAIYLKGRFPGGGTIFAVGEDGLLNSLSEYGFYPGEENVLAVVAGMDRQLTYTKLCQAAMLIRAGAPFIGTNADRTFPTPGGLVPGAGAVLAALETATDVKPFIIGKPAPEMYRVALGRLKMTPNQTLVIGDRLETDIAGAQSLGCPTGLVLSGVTSEKQARGWLPAPDFIGDDLANILRQF